MLQAIRDKSSGPIAYAIVGLIALVFSVWGIGSYFTGSANPAVATVAGTDITQYQLQRAYNQRYQRLQQLLGDNFDPQTIDTQGFRRNVLQGLIQDTLLTAYAQDQGYRITDAQLLGAITADSRFAVDGQFSAERYHTMLSQAGIGAAGFEAGLRHDLATRQVRATILDTAFATSRDIARTYRLVHQEREMAALLFDPSAYTDQVEIGADEVQAWYQAHPQAFMRPERVKLKYVVLDRDELEAAQAPDPAVLKTLYEQEKEARFQTSERRRARQLLIQVDADTTAEQARQKIQKIAEKIKKPDVSFADVARKSSDDEATADKGGQMDWVARGTLVEPLDNALFALAPGEVSAPVKTEFGWHLLKLEEIQPGKTKPIDDPEVQAELLALYQDKARDERFRKMRKQLDSLSFEAPTSLDLISQKLGLAVQTSDWITKKGSSKGFGSNPAVAKAAFSPAVLQDGLNSTPIELGANRLAVLRVGTHQRAQRLPLDQVKNKIVERLQFQAAQKIARGEAKKALDGLRADAKWSDLAAKHKGKVIESHWVGRAQTKLDSKLHNVLFAMPKPAEHPQYTIATTGAKKIALLRLSAVKAPELDDSKVDSKALTRALRGRIAGLEYAVFSAALRQQYDVDIHEQRLP